VEIAATTVSGPAGSGAAEATHQAVLRIEKAPARPATALTYTAHPAAVAVGSTVRLRISCFNGTGAAVSRDRIQFALPVGTGAAGLTVQPGRVTATVDTPGWSVAADGQGGFVLTPSAEVSPTIAPGAAIEVELVGIDVVAEPGFAVLAVAETAAAGPPESGARTVTGVSALMNGTTPIVGRSSAGVEKRALP
jgi:hypothetical protein